MSFQACDMESQILESCRRGGLGAPQRHHLASCLACRQAVHIDVLLRSDATETPAMDRLPDPTVVWWRARQRSRLRHAERAALPIQIAERLALALGAAGLLIGGSLAWPSIRSAFSSWSESWMKGLPHALPLDGMSLILTLFCSLLLLIGFGLYSQWNEG